MNEVQTVAEHLKRLAQNYRETHLTLQTRYREMTSAEDFLAELRQREAALINRFRLVQQNLLTTLAEEELEKVLELSRVFDEMRIINQFAFQALAEADQSDNNHLEEK